MDREYLPQDNVLLFNVESSMANQYIRDLAVVSRRGMQSKADKGWLPSRCPLGYYNDLLTNEIYVDEKRWDLVRKMWDLLLTGNYTVPQIQEEANGKWGFRTPTTKRMGGGPIALSTLYKMFTNQFYTGMFEWAGNIYQGNHKVMITTEEYDRAQYILGRKGKPRNQVHESSYTGVITCGECGAMCTCTVKKKIVKKTGMLTPYVYYNCTKKKRDSESHKVVCKQDPVTLDELEKQIDIELERYTILPKFQEWAIEILNKGNDKEIQERTKIYESQQQAYNKTQKEIDTLTQMRYRELIDDAEFLVERERLKKQLLKLKDQLSQTENRAKIWLDLTEKTFNFARYARKAYLNGDIQVKREMFTALGQNFSLKAKRVTIEANEWFVPIEKAYPALKAEFDRLELDKNLSTESRNEQIASLILSWGDVVEDVRTIFQLLNDTSIYIPAFA